MLLFLVLLSFCTVRFWKKMFNFINSIELIVIFRHIYQDGLINVFVVVFFFFIRELIFSSLWNNGNYFLQFCCKDAIGYETLTSVNFVQMLSEDHLSCSIPQYIFLSGIMGYICVSIFLKLAAAIKFLLMFSMAVVYVVAMEVTHAAIFDDFDLQTRWITMFTKVIYVFKLILINFSFSFR